MKQLKQSIFALMCSLFLLSCNEESNLNYESQSVSFNLESSMAHFESAVAILEYGNPAETFSEAVKSGALIMNIVKFNEDVTLKDEYHFNGVHFTDNGQYNDLIAGDGIYASTLNLAPTDQVLIGSQYIVHTAKNFAFEEELLLHLELLYPNVEPTNSQSLETFSMGCKFSIANCEEFNGSDCIEFLDCETSSSFIFN